MKRVKGPLRSPIKHLAPCTPDVVYHKTAGAFQTFREEKELDVKDIETVLAFYWKPESYVKVLDKLLADGRYGQGIVCRYPAEI